MDDVARHTARRGVSMLAIVVATTLSGCSMVPRERLDESQRLAKSLRTENARLKDQIVGLQSQNRDSADRAVDDLRRITARDQAIEHLERSVESYRDDRDRLAAAYQRLTTSLGRAAGDDATIPAADSRQGASLRGQAVRTAGLPPREPEAGLDEGDGHIVDAPPVTASRGSGP